MCAPGGDTGVGDGGAAGPAGLPPSAVDPVVILVGPPGPETVAVGPHRGPAAVDRLPEDLLNGPVEPEGPGSVDRRRGRTGVNSRAVEALIDVDVSQAGNAALVEEEGLDGPAAPSEDFSEIPGRQMQGVGSELVEEGNGGLLFLADEGEITEFPGIDEGQLPLPALELQVKPLPAPRGVVPGDDEEPPRHLQVKEEHGPVGEVKEEELAFPAQTNETGPFERSDSLGRGLSQNAPLEDANPEEPSSEELSPQADDHGFDFREFRHDFQILNLFIILYIYNIYSGVKRANGVPWKQTLSIGNFLLS